MVAWIKQLDRLLRGDATRMEALRGGRIELPVAGLTVVGVVLGMIYGVCMGVFSVTGSGSQAPLQIVASALKVPALFLLTLVVTFPSLYVFNALVGSALAMRSVLRLLVGTMAIMITVLASLGPIVAFFALTATSYPFMKLLNVAVFAICGILGGGFLLRTLQRLTFAAQAADAAARDAAAPPARTMVAGSEIKETPATTVGGAPARKMEPGAISAMPGMDSGTNVRAVFRVWVVVFGLVGAQMAWILRPFIGDPNLPFQWFRPRQSNFFEAVIRAIEHLF